MQRPTLWVTARCHLGNDSHSGANFAVPDTHHGHTAVLSPRTMPGKWGLCQRGDRRHGWAKRAGAQRRCPLFLSLSWRQEDSANVLGAGNYVLILGSLHDHQLHSAWTAAPRNLFSKTNRNVFYIGSLAARMGSDCSRACRLEPRPSVVLRKCAGQFPHQTYRPQVGGHRAEGQWPAAWWAP